MGYRSEQIARVLKESLTCEKESGGKEIIRLKLLCKNMKTKWLDLTSSELEQILEVLKEQEEKDLLEDLRFQMNLIFPGYILFLYKGDIALLQRDESPSRDSYMITCVQEPNKGNPKFSFSGSTYDLSFKEACKLFYEK